jgi:hypothetical protein
MEGHLRSPSPVKLECRHMTYNVLVLRKTQLNKQTEGPYHFENFPKNDEWFCPD